MPADIGNASKIAQILPLLLLSGTHTDSYPMPEIQFHHPCHSADVFKHRGTHSLKEGKYAQPLKQSQEYSKHRG